MMKAVTRDGQRRGSEDAHRRSSHLGSPQNVAVVLITDGREAVGTFRVAQNPIETSVSPGSSVVLKPALGVAVMTFAGPANAAFHDEKMLVSCLSKVTL